MSSPTDNQNQNQPLGPNYSRLRTYLAQSKTQKSNNPLFQTISQLITGTSSFQNFVEQNFGSVNAAFGSFTQIINAIDAALTSLTNEVGAIETEINDVILPALALLAAQAIYLVEVDTSGGPQSFNLSSYTTGFVIFKDVSGNAGANNITLVGTVDGVVDPVISTNYGVYRVYWSLDYTAFYTW